MTSPAAPVRRRPRDRRRQILAAAAARFWSLGYHQVGMADVATAVGIAPSALYRHVRGKEELLLAILDEHLTRIERLVEESPGDLSGDLVDGLAALTLERREFGLLWERESGHLPDEARRAIRHRLRAVAGVVAARGAEPDPATADLRAWAALSVVDSPSHHRYELDDARFRRLLAAAARAVLATPLPPAAGPSADPPRPGVLAPASRREALLAAATRLFGERGYPAVGLGDIGAAAGIAGPSVYRHFTTKPDLLLRTLHRGNEALWLGLHHALGRARDAPDAVARLAADYTAFVADNPEIVSVLVSQVIHLPTPSRDELRRSQRDYVAEWVALLTAARPGLPAPEARVLVHATLALINGLTRVPHLAVQPGARARIAALAEAVLAAEG
ncbi:TetR/AcrR family transcriptional regulator [Actinomycetospora chibensis]|uniref:TetR/AcrR family transcriptional regulator n=1 Tax=Actinomycetospora chibensis TaxID=663606 RepID=A0ABV9RJE3_9PSEU|nr:TetR/AcrR family transcriptional regulator [Actinomycetospora chibensis]MDD7923812.1 TetR family transcriptional regulator [Actinomycetospora chibensis]